MPRILPLPAPAADPTPGEPRKRPRRTPDNLPWIVAGTCIVVSSIIIVLFVIALMQRGYLLDRLEFTRLYPPAEPARGFAFAGYAGTSFEKPTFVRFERGTLNFAIADWTLGKAVITDNSSVRVSGRLRVTKAGFHNFYLHADDRGRLWVNHQKLFDNWQPMADVIVRGQKSAPINLPEGEWPLVFEVRNSEGYGWIGLEWSAPGMERRFLTGDDFVRDIVGGGVEAP